jgi:hypothetical protein
MNLWGPAALIVAGYLVSLLLFQFKLTDQTNKRIDDLRADFKTVREDVKSELKSLRDELKERTAKPS